MNEAFIDYKAKPSDSLLKAIQDHLSSNKPKKSPALKELVQAVNRMAKYEALRTKLAAKIRNLPQKPSKKEKISQEKEFVAAIEFLEAVADLQVKLIAYAAATDVLLDKALRTYLEIRNGEYADIRFESVDEALIQEVDEEAAEVELLELSPFEEFEEASKTEASKVNGHKAPLKKTTQQQKATTQKPQVQKPKETSKPEESKPANLPKEVLDTLAQLQKNRANWQRKATKLHKLYPHIFPSSDVTAVKAILGNGN